VDDVIGGDGPAGGIGAANLDRRRARVVDDQEDVVGGLRVGCSGPGGEKNSDEGRPDP